MNVFQIIAIVLGIVAAVWDLKSRRIPNFLTFGGALAAILVHGYVEGLSGAGWSVAGWLVGAAFFMPFFALGGMGAGDVKLLAALGAWLGWAMLPTIILLSSVVGALVGISLIVFARRGRDKSIPFGPYLAAAGLIALLYGSRISEQIQGVLAG